MPLSAFTIPARADDATPEFLQSGRPIQSHATHVEYTPVIKCQESGRSVVELRASTRGINIAAR